MIWGIDMEQPTKLTSDKRIRASGHSLILTITEECDILGVDYGDIVRVTIERIDN